MTDVVGVCVCKSSYDNFLREYAKYMPFGLTIAGAFLPALHDPQEFDMAHRPMRTYDEISKEGYERGGTAVDIELRALVVDMYNLYQELNLDLTVAVCGGDDEHGSRITETACRC